MPPFLWVTFWGAVYLFVGGGLAISSALWGRARRKNQPILKWVFGLLFAACAAVALCGISWYAYDCYLDSLPDVAFRRAFHREPRGVQLLHGGSGHFVDSGGIDLAFRADRETFDSLRTETMDRGTLEDYRRLDIYKPKWWRMPVETSEIWISKEEYATTVMMWDSDGLVQFSWFSLD